MTWRGELRREEGWHIQPGESDRRVQESDQELGPRLGDNSFVGAEPLRDPTCLIVTVVHWSPVFSSLPLYLCYSVTFASSVSFNDSQ